jgi:high affinity sulfate transporter 1
VALLKARDIVADARQRTSILPILDWLPRYGRKTIRYDLLAGLTTAAVVIPKAMAYATIAGLPVQVGLYTIFIPMVVYAVLGTSRPLSTSTTTTIAILTAAQLADLGPDATQAQLASVAALLALMVGVILALAAVLRLGVVANFISDPVLTGFKAGIGLVIIVDQLPKLFGVHFAKGTFLQNIIGVARHLPETSLPTLAVAASVLAIIVVMEHVAPKFPAVLLAVAGAIAAAALFQLPAHGVETVGHIPSGLPGFALPDLARASALWPGALGIALMSFTETIAAGRAFAQRPEPRPTANRELVALGLANVGAGLFGAMPAGGGTSQTAVNRGAGARTQVAQLVTAAVAVATLLFLSPVVALLPQGALGAVVIGTSLGLIKPHEFRAIRRVRDTEFLWAVIAMLGVVMVGTLKGILVAVVASLVFLFQQAQDPPVYVLRRKRGTNVFRPRDDEFPDDEEWPGLLLLRPTGRIYFGNAQRVGDKMWPLVLEASPKVVVIDFSAVPDLEYSVLRAMEEVDERLRADGITLWVAALNPAAREAFDRAPIGRAMGRERMLFNLEVAVERYGQLPA